MPNVELIIVGVPEEHHVGAHFLSAARALGLEAELVDSRSAYQGPWLLNKINWWLRSHRPTRLTALNEDLAARLDRSTGVRWLLTTGIAPVTSATLRHARLRGISSVNYLTDDPWNPAHRTPWFFQALPEYDSVFSPRRANLDDLARHGCRAVAYLPFAYAPEIHFREEAGADESARYASDVVVVGGADRDRFEVMLPLIRAGMNVHLYGGYWDRNKETRPHWRGFADASVTRKAIAGGRVVIGMVRTANRDGHSMRSFEVPAMGGCLLLQDTAEHRSLFGAHRESALYYGDADSVVAETRWLLDHPDERDRIAAHEGAAIVGGANTYADRLRSMLGL